MTKYRGIREVLIDRITSGAWSPGAPIPHEVALAAEFGVTRPTISRALRDLVQGGLVERKRRAGSRVAARPAWQSLLRIPVVREEIERRRGRYGYLLLDRRLAPPPPSIRATFRLGVRDRALNLRCVHLKNGRGYQLEDRWINQRALPEAAGQDFAAVSANEWLVAKVPFSRAEHVLSAAAAGDEEANALGLPAGSPLFVIERTTWRGADALTQVRLAHPAADFRITARSIL